MFRKLLVVCLFTSFGVWAVIVSSDVFAHKQQGNQPKRANPNAASVIRSSRTGKLPQTTQQLQVKKNLSGVVLREQAFSTISKLPGIEKVVEFKDRKAFPRNGYKMFQLADDSIFVSIDRPAQPAMEGWIGTFTGGYMFVMCSCSNDYAKTDDCHFENGTATSPGSCLGSCSCKARHFLYWDNRAAQEIIG